MVPSPHLCILQVSFSRNKTEKEIFDETRRLLDLDGIELKTQVSLKASRAIIITEILQCFPNDWKGGADSPFTTPPNIKEFKINIIDFKSNLFVSEIVVKRDDLQERT